MPTGAAARIVGISLVVLTTLYFASQALVVLLNTGSVELVERWLPTPLVLGAYDVDVVLMVVFWQAVARKIRLCRD